MRCSICGQAFDPAATITMPFCSERCRSIDLGRWFDGRYSVARLCDDETTEPQENEVACD